MAVGDDRRRWNMEPPRRSDPPTREPVLEKNPPPPKREVPQGHSRETSESQSLRSLIPSTSSSPIGNGMKRQGLLRGRSSKKWLIPTMIIFFISGLALIKNISKDNSSEQNSGVESQQEETITTTLESENSPSTPREVVEAEGPIDWNTIATSVVYVDGTNDPDCLWAGSGTIVGDGSYVLTNAHVAIKDDGETPCKLAVGIISSVNSAPDVFYWATAVEFDYELDLAVLRVLDNYGKAVKISEARPMNLTVIEPQLGDEITVIGFPGMGGSTTTLTNGNYAGLSDGAPPFFKTSAIINHGNSGGAAFDKKGNFIGVPTQAVSDSQGDIANSLGLIRPLRFAITMLENSQGSQPASFNPGITSEIMPAGYDEQALDPRFDTCREAKSNGYGPYYSGVDAEYDWYRDRDGDGVVCE